MRFSSPLAAHFDFRPGAGAVFERRAPLPWALRGLLCARCAVRFQNQDRPCGSVGGARYWTGTALHLRCLRAGPGGPGRDARYCALLCAFRRQFQARPGAAVQSAIPDEVLSESAPLAGLARRRWQRGVLLDRGTSAPLAAVVGPGPDALAGGRDSARGFLCAFHRRLRLQAWSEAGGEARQY